MARIWLPRSLGHTLFGLWLVLLALFQQPVLNLIHLQWVNVLLGVLLIAAGVFHLIEL